MDENKIAILFHDLLGPASSIRNFLYFVLTKKGKSLDKKTEYFIKASLESSEILIKRLQSLHQNWTEACNPIDDSSKKEPASQEKTINSKKP